MATLTASPIGIETLDDPAADPAVVARMLHDIARANRWFGGVGAVERGLGLLFGPDDRGATATLLDVGTGAGDLPLAAARWGARRGIRIVPCGIERHRAAARLACDHGVPTAVACGTQLPFGQGDPRGASGEEGPSAGQHPSSLAPRGSPAVDVVLLSQLLHHFDDATAIRLLAEAAAVARRGVIVIDLRPSRSAAALFRLAGWAMRFHPATVADGVTSLARGRSARATATLARRAGAVRVQARDLPLARVLAAWRTAH